MRKTTFKKIRELYITIDKANSKESFIPGTAGDENKSQPGDNIWKTNKFEIGFYCEKWLFQLKWTNTNFVQQAVLEIQYLAECGKFQPF